MARPEGRVVFVSDRMQKRYFYELTAPSGRDFDPEFKPQLTPREMLRLGIFGGVYMRDCRREFPRSWFDGAKLAPQNVRTPVAALNFFGVNASQPLAVWRRRGWIYEEDPRGWFQWYCRYHMGRRIPAEDSRQIRRWKAIARHIAQLRKHCPPGDLSCRPKQRQAILHWAFDSRKM